MSTLDDIEAAIELLPDSEVEALANWLQRRRQAASPTNVSVSSRSVRDFFGKFASGNPQGGDNLQIDRDLAGEASEGLR